MEKEIQIKEEIRQWSTEVLELPSQEFNGLPPCPYAKKAWRDNKVRLRVIEKIKDCDLIKEQCPDDDSVDVVAWVGYESMSTGEFDEWIDNQNKNHQGTWTIGFHPDHPVDESLDEFEGNGAPEYALILIQSLGHLSKSSNRIFNKGYYDKYSKSDINHINRRNII